MRGPHTKLRSLKKPAGQVTLGDSYGNDYQGMKHAIQLIYFETLIVIRQARENQINAN